MAKLDYYFGLCPLIDQRSLLGISEDAEEGHVIVTLGKNIAIKYKVSDQKQVHSWRTKDKFTSPVIFDKTENKYVAVFNQSYIRMWYKEDEHLDKQKKYKFNSPIYTILSCADKSILIFNNGAVLPLSTAIEQRKTLEPDGVVTKTDEYIFDVIYTNVKDVIFIGIIISDSNRQYFTWVCSDDNIFSQHHPKVVLERPNQELIGYMFNKTANLKNVALYTLWSDSKFYSLSLNEANFPGFLCAVIESLSCDQLVTTVALDGDYIAMYGADNNGEGATLILYNIQFKVTQFRQPLKMFSNGAKLWQIENNIFLCIGQNLAVIPFHLDTEQLAALVGSHKLVLTNTDDDDVAIVQNLDVVQWEEQHETEPLQVPGKLKKKVVDFCQQGIPVSTMCELLISDFIAEEDSEGIVNCLKYFYDFPENCIGKMLKYALRADSKHFDGPSKSSSNIQPLQRRVLVNQILALNFNDVHLMPYLRKELDITDVIVILKYIIYLLSEDECVLPKLDAKESENKVIDWGCLLLDASYQKILLSRDEDINEVLIKFNCIVKEHLHCLRSIDGVVSLLELAVNGKPLKRNIHNSNSKYTVETISLY